MVTHLYAPRRRKVSPEPIKTHLRMEAHSIAEASDRVNCSCVGPNSQLFTSYRLSHPESAAADEGSHECRQRRRSCKFPATGARRKGTTVFATPAAAGSFIRRGGLSMTPS